MKLIDLLLFFTQTETQANSNIIQFKKYIKLLLGMQNHAVL